MKRKVMISLFVFSFAVFGYSQGVDRLGRPSWISTAKSQTAAPQTPGIDPAVQTARRSYFNVSPQDAAVLPDLSTPVATGPQMGHGAVNEVFNPEQFPTSKSDAVVTATVTSQIPYLSQDNRQVYSELTFTPVSIVKDATKTLAAEQPATILAGGGRFDSQAGALCRLYRKAARIL